MPQRAPKHRPSHASRRPSAHRRGYDAHWQKVRAAILLRDPVCVICRRAPSRHVDHVVALEKGGTHDPANLRGMCPSCHSRKTVVEDMDGTGFGPNR